MEKKEESPNPEEKEEEDRNLKCRMEGAIVGMQR